MGRAGGRRAYKKLSDAERARFLEALRETGNRRFAAEAIGEDPRSMDQRREHDPELDREWREAVEAADRKLSKMKAPFGCAPLGELTMIKRGKGGRLQLVAAGKGRWTAEIEEQFIAVLRVTGSVRAAARAVGFCEGTAWGRRRTWPAFAQRFEEALEDAEMALEFRIAAMGNNVIPAEDEDSGDARPSPASGGEGGDAAPPRFDMDDALRFLKWREEKRRGRGNRAPRAKPPSIEEVTEKIVRRVEAIKRHRRREAGE